MLRDGFVYALQDSEAVLEDVVVPEAQDAVTPGEEEGVSFFVVVLPFGVLAAVELDQDFSGQAGEIDDIGADGVLAAEAVAVKLVVAQVVPEKPFGVGSVAAEGLGGGQGALAVAAADDPPTGAPAGWRPWLADSPSRGE